MRIFEKATKLDNVLYDVRGPVVDEANRMEQEGMQILKLNIGNPAPFGFTAPDEVIRDMRDSIVNSQGYSDSRGIFAARTVRHSDSTLGLPERQRIYRARRQSLPAARGSLQGT